MVSKTVASNTDIVASNDFKSLVRGKSLVELFPVGMDCNGQTHKETGLRGEQFGVLD